MIQNKFSSTNHFFIDERLADGGVNVKERYDKFVSIHLHADIEDKP